MKKTLLLFLVTIVSAITALASPTGKIMGESKDIPIQRLNQQTTNPFRPHAPERVLFSACLDTDLGLLLISSAYNVNEVSACVENLSTGEIEYYIFDSSEVAILPISGTSGYWRMTLTLENGDEYIGEFQL